MRLETFLLLFLFSTCLSLTINCRYNEWDWNFSKNVYECQGHHANKADTLPYLTNFTGIHMGGGNHTEVQALRVMHETSITFAPTGIGKHFPNLMGLSFMNCNLKTISNEHLVEFPGMLQVSYAYNQIEVLPGDLFIYNPKLRLVNFQGNMIKHIAVSIFKPITELEYIWLAKNPCIDMNSNAAQLKKIKKQILKTCRMGGKTDCKRIPPAFSQNSKELQEICEHVPVYRFKPLPRHQLEKLAREKEEKEQKEREHYVNNILRICEYDDAIVRFLLAVFNEKGKESQPEWVPPPVDWKKVDKDAKKKKKKNKKKKN